MFYGEKPQTITQLALHYFDTVYGHIQIPLAGKIDDHLTDISELPTSAPKQITDAFSMAVTGKSDLNEYLNYKPVRNRSIDDPFTRQNTILRTIQARFDSNVQALLSIDPKERFYYVVETEEGPLMTKMNDIVHNIPLGFTGNTLLAPGASNTVYMPYEMPAALSSASSYLFGDVATGSIELPVTKGSPYKTSSRGLKFTHEYFDLIINDLCPSPFSSNYIVLDVTVKDKKDGFGTNGLNRIFALEKKAENNKNRKYIEADGRTNESLYGIYGDWAVFDGQSRRGIILFFASENYGDFLLRSPYFKDMAVEIENKTYAYPELLALEHPAKIDRDFENQLNKAVTSAVARYKANQAKTKESPIQRIGISPEENEGVDIPAPAASVFGDRVLSSLTSEEDFYKLMYALRWLPAQDNDYYYAPEAVITQGWGTQWDMYNLAENALARLGIESTYRRVALTQRGKEALSFISGVKNTRCNDLPAIAFRDSSGESHIFVIPFMRDVTELSGLLYLPTSQAGGKPDPARVRMTINAIAEGLPENKGSLQSGLFEAFAQATSGAENQGDELITKEITLFEKELSIPSLSLGPIDIGYFVAAKSDDGGDLVKAVVDTTDGLLQGSGFIDTGKDKLKSVTVNMKFTGAPSGGYTHTTILEEGQKLPDICHTLAFGLPEISEKAGIMLQETSVEEANKAKGINPNNASKIRWYTRGVLYRYIMSSTLYDQETAEQLNLVLGRVNHPLALMVTCRSDGTNATASIDLMRHQNQVLEGEKENINAYRLFGGMYASVLEGNAMADGSGISFVDVWESLPKRIGFVLIEDTNEARTLALEKMAGSYPEVLLRNIKQALDKNSSTVFLVPEAAGEVLGEPRWAWLEMDSKTFDTVSVFDTGERSGMSSYILGMMNNKDMQGYMGYFVGMSCATWSISAYSLETDDYKEIKKKSAILCAEILSQLEETLALAEKGPIDYIKDKLKDEIKVGGIGIKDIKKLTKIPAGFSEGFRLAVEVYFGLNIK